MLTDLPDILCDTEEGFVDLTFAVTRREYDDDGTQRFTAESLYGKERVGLAIELHPTWKAGDTGNSIPFQWGSITYRSIGPLSDHFVRLLDRLYGTNLAPGAMRDSTRFTAVALANDPGSLDTGTVHIKLFFEHEDDERYAEVYTNFDVPNARIQIREKDGGYRTALVQALTHADA